MKLLLATIFVVGCSKPNPNSCCTSADQCNTLGLDGLTACKSGQVCDPYGACVKPQCATSADCTSPDAPLCVDQLCVAKCSANGDCDGIAGKPFCASDGTCVACEDDTACSGDTPICDAVSHACRGCAVDTECSSGVCLEQQGVCADAANVVFIQSGGLDNGTCSESAPCASFAFALPQTSSQRNIIRVRGVSFDVGGSTVNFSLRTLFIDGEDTVVTRSTPGAVFTVGSGSMTFEGMAVGTGGGSNESVSVTGGVVDLNHMRVLAPIAQTGGTLTVETSTVAADVNCSNGGTLTVRGNAMTASVAASGCISTIQRNRITDAQTTIYLDGSTSVFENNVLVDHGSFLDGVNIANGATARFNTLVNLSGVDSGAMSLSCNGTVEATSNIIAWHSSHPPCASKYSLFDEIAGTQPGMGNVTGNAASFFVDPAGGDFHLATGSPAVGAGEPGLPVMVDIDGNPRPNPMGSSPDIGAYEAP